MSCSAVYLGTPRGPTAGAAVRRCRNGLGLVWLGSDAVRAFLFRIEPLDTVTLVAVASGIVALAVAVSIGPAIAAMRVDLAKMLREE